MKAKEYFEKYNGGLLSAEEKDCLSAAQGLIVDLVAEARQVAEKRHVKFDRGFIPILKEQNDKYRAIVRMFEREYGWSPIRSDGYEIVIDTHFPGVLDQVKGREQSRKVYTHTREDGSNA